MGEPRRARGVLAVLGADAPADVSALIREAHARGVADAVAAGAGRGAAVVSAVECESVALIAPPADVSLRARRALVCCAKGDHRSWGDATVDVFGIDGERAGGRSAAPSALVASSRLTPVSSPPLHGFMLHHPERSPRIRARVTRHVDGKEWKARRRRHLRPCIDGRS